jgi:hypothetical protein
MYAEGKAPVRAFPIGRRLIYLQHAHTQTRHLAKPADERRPPEPALQPLPETVRLAVVDMATQNPWSGYKWIAVMCRRAQQAVTDRHAYVAMRDASLLRIPRPREPELYQATKLFELLPQQPNDLWQMDETYIDIPGYGWWYAVTVIRSFPRKSTPAAWPSRFSSGGVGRVRRKQNWKNHWGQWA